MSVFDGAHAGIDGQMVGGMGDVTTIELREMVEKFDLGKLPPGKIHFDASDDVWLRGIAPSPSGRG